MEIDFLVKSHLAFCGAALEHQAKQLELAFAWVSIYPIKCKDKRERDVERERGGNPLLLWISRDNLWLLYRVKGRRKFWKPKGVNSNVVGIICSPDWDRVKTDLQKYDGGPCPPASTALYGACSSGPQALARRFGLPLFWMGCIS
jgi:hypothetical protein